VNNMNVSCNDRDRILRNAEPAELAALEVHAASCPACALELREWNELSRAAHELRDAWDSPSLWPRIHEALTAEESRNRFTWNILSFWRNFILHWQAVAAAFLLLALTGSGAWLFWRVSHVVPPQPVGASPFLKADALAEVDRAEAAYIQAINKLAAQAQPRLENPGTPLLAGYREKLLVIDAAIADLRAGIDQNRSNAHLRAELTSLLQEKKETLEAILQEESR
jgi:anti-sigma factor RsiW